MVSAIMNAIDSIPDNTTAPSIFADPVSFELDVPAMANEIPCAKNIETMYIMKFMIKPSFLRILQEHIINGIFDLCINALWRKSYERFIFLLVKV